jgi:tRNA(Ile)-lysidine synthase
MKIQLEPGRYVVAVSGGVDSVVLLDMLFKAQKNPADLLVAHFDHGIRKDSAADRRFVGDLARKYGLEFFYEQGSLGRDASEALAREKRYEFLNKIKNQTAARAIVTAHHKDDVLETVIINLLRGTGRKGLSSLTDRPDLKRPLLDFSKAQLIDYAQENNLQWREDETNADEKYFRNYVRHRLISRLSSEQKNQLLDISKLSRARNQEIDKLLAETFINKTEISRSLFAGLGHEVSSEIVAAWLRKEGVRLDKKTVESLVIKLKTVREGKIIQTSQGGYFTIHGGMIRLNSKGSV